MKGLIAGLALSVFLHGLLPFSAGAETHAGSQPDVTSTQAAVPAVQEDPISPDNLDRLAEVASGRVIEPREIVWNVDGSGLYVVSAEAVFVLTLSDGQLRELATISPKETVMALSPAGVMAVMQTPETVVLRDVHTDEELLLLSLEVPVTSARFSPDGGSIALVLDDGSLLRTWDVATGDMLGAFRNPEEAGGAYSIVFSPSGDSVVWLSPTAGRRLDLATGVFGPPMTFPNTLLDGAISPDGELLVTTADGVLSFWAANGSLLLSEPGVAAGSLSYSTSGELVAAATGGDMTILDTPSLSALHSLPRLALDAVFSPSDHALAVAGADGTISIWVARYP
jgi:WD40 repeat protein